MFLARTQLGHHPPAFTNDNLDTTIKTIESISRCPRLSSLAPHHPSNSRSKLCVTAKLSFTSKNSWFRQIKYSSPIEVAVIWTRHFTTSIRTHKCLTIRKTCKMNSSSRIWSNRIRFSSQWLAGAYYGARWAVRGEPLIIHIKANKKQQQLRTRETWP